MLTLDSMKSKLTSHLIDYTNDNIVNYVEGQLRNNIQLVKLTEFSIAGAYNSRMRYVKLPGVATTFHLFAFNVIDISWLYKTAQKMAGETWITLQELCNVHNINIDIYTIDGLMIPKHMCYISVNSSSSTRSGYIAVDTRTVNIKKLESNNTYLTIYLDSSTPKDRRVYSYNYVLGDNESKLTNVLSKYILNKNITSIYIDGYFYHQPGSNILNTVYLRNKEVEVIVEENTELSFNIDTRNRYHSTTDNKQKDIIHIPKRFGYDKIRTINLAHIFVFDKTTKKGVKIPFVMNSKYYQLTYNDLGIPSDIIDNAKTFIGSEEVELHVKINDYDSDNNTVKYNNEWLPVLSEVCSDDQLIDIYAGRVPSLIEFLSGDVLEQSMFNKLMFNVTPLLNNDETLDMLINGIGYYNLPSVIGKNVFHIDVTSSYQLSELSFPKNLLIDNGSMTYLGHVFINGKKIATDLCSFRADDNNIHITIYGNFRVNPGDKIDVAVNVGDIGYHMRCQPSSLGYTYVFTSTTMKEFDMVDIYVVSDVSQMNFYGPEKEHLSHGYTKLTDTQRENLIYDFSYNTNSSEVTITFSANAFGGTYILVPKVYNQFLVKQINIIKDDVFDRNIVIHPTTNTLLSSAEIPYLGVGSYEVFLNGRKLNEGMDYQYVKKELAYSKTHVADYIIIQNLDYMFIDGNNVIDVIVKGYEVVDKATGFVVDKKFGGGDNINNLWFTDNSILYIDGLFVRTDMIDYKYSDEFVVTGDIDIANVSSYSIETSYPILLDNVVKEFVTDIDKRRMTAVMAYLITIDPYEPPAGEGLVTQYRSIYSSFLNELVYIILTDNDIGNSFSYTDQEVLALISQHEYLREYDVIFDEGFFKKYPVYRRFYNLHAAYVEVYPVLTLDLRSIGREISPTKAILIRAVIDRVLIEFLSID